MTIEKHNALENWIVSMEIQLDLGFLWIHL